MKSMDAEYNANQTAPPRDSRLKRDLCAAYEWPLLIPAGSTGAHILGTQGWNAKKNSCDLKETPEPQLTYQRKTKKEDTETKNSCFHLLLTRI